MKLLPLALLALSVSCGKQVKTEYIERIIEVDKPALPKLSCSVYDLSATTPNNLPNFSTLEAIGKVEVESLNNPVTNNVTPFPMLDDTDYFNLTEKFALVCVGKLKIKSKGTHTFYLNSDDGSKLYLNDYLIISNNGNHASIKKNASIVLLEDEVTVRVEYFNGFGDKTLMLSIKEPNVIFEELIKF